MGQPALPANFGGSGMVSGTLKQNRGSHGFIAQDNGEKDMFVLPMQCQGGELPPVGTRVSYVVIISDRNGRPMADNVHPEGDTFLAELAQAQAASNGSGAEAYGGAAEAYGSAAEALFGEAAAEMWSPA